MRTTQHRHWAAAAMGIALAVGTAGCAPGGAADTGSSQSTIITDPSKIPATTIKELDQFTDDTSALAIYMNKVNAAFMAKYPQIKVERSAVGGDLGSTLKLKLSDPSAPDIVPANEGWQGIGDLSAAGLLLNLDPWAKAYGWDQRFPSSFSQQRKATTDGKSIGQGSYFGAPVNQAAFVGTFYNRALMNQLGLKIPTTLQEFEDSLAKAKAAGITPISLGLQDQSGSAVLLALQDALGDPAKIREIVYNTGNVAIADSGMPQAADTFAQWVKNQYFSPDMKGLKINDALQNFVDGKSLYTFTYTGYLPTTPDKLDAFGVFALPGTAGNPAVASGGAAQNFSVAKNTKSPDAAAAYLNFISSVDNGQISIDVLNCPAIGQWPTNTKSPMLNDTLAIANAVNKSNGYIPFFDWSSPTMYATITGNQTSLADGQLNDTTFTKALQDDIDQFHASRK